MLTNEFDRISSNPDILHGKPCIKGTRVPVYLIVRIITDMLAENNLDINNILENYPTITQEDIIVALKYASKLTEHEAYAI